MLLSEVESPTLGKEQGEKRQISDWHKSIDRVSPSNSSHVMKQILTIGKYSVSLREKDLLNEL